MTLYILCGVGAVIIAALAYKIGQLNERIENERRTNDSYSVAQQARNSLHNVDVIDRLHNKFKR